MAHISTPCINVCVMDEATSLCMGCGRTRDEIACWAALGEEERRRIMAGLDRRVADLTASASRGTS